MIEDEREILCDEMLLRRSLWLINDKWRCCGDEEGEAKRWTNRTYVVLHWKLVSRGRCDGSNHNR